MNIAVFDSGQGGHFVAKRLQSLLSEHTYTIIDDIKNVPYGQKSSADVIRLTENAIKSHLDSCPIVVIACNTATALAIDYLRKTYPQNHFIGYEPMVKSITKLSNNNHATVLATRATKNSVRYNNLKILFAKDYIIDEPDTTNWASYIENKQANLINLESVKKSVESGSDVITLACTHYLAIEDDLKNQFPNIKIIEPTPAVALRIKTIVDLLQQ